jgi:hypothetical protein
METLPPKTQEQIKKMSSEYLVLKLTKAGIDEEVILKMSREQLMAAWAELISTGKDKPAIAVGDKAVGASAASVHYDHEIERQRLAFEMQKYEEEKAERLRLYEEAKAERLRLELKAEADRSFQQTQFEWQQAQFDWQRARADAEVSAQEEQFKWQREKEQRERANRESIAAQL